MNETLIRRLSEKRFSDQQITALVNTFNLLVLGRILARVLEEVTPSEREMLNAALINDDREGIVSWLKQRYGEPKLQEWVAAESEAFLEPFMARIGLWENRA